MICAGARVALPSLRALVVVVVAAAAAAGVVTFEEAVPEITVAKSDVNHLHLGQSIAVLLHWGFLCL